MTRFWMICRQPRHEHSRTEPRERFATEAEAQTAAQAMADQTGHPFVILTATRIVFPQSGQDRLL